MRKNFRNVTLFAYLAVVGHGVLNATSLESHMPHSNNGVIIQRGFFFHENILDKSDIVISM